MIRSIINFFDKLYNSSSEGFEQESRFILKENDDVFEDPFYVGIYDELFYKKLLKQNGLEDLKGFVLPNVKGVVLPDAKGLKYHEK